MQSEQLKKINKLYEKSNYLKLVRPFSGLITHFEIDQNNKLVNLDINLNSELVGSTQYFSVYECSCEEEIMLPGHKHDVDEVLIVLEGEIIRVENGIKYGPKEMCCVRRFEPHTFFIKAGSKFLCIFYPPIEVERAGS